VVVTVLITIKTKDVQLWYPRGYGEQHLYALRVGFNGHHMKKRIGYYYYLLLILLFIIIIVIIIYYYYCYCL